MRLATIAAIKVGSLTWEHEPYKKRCVEKLRELELPEELYPVVASVWTRYDQLDDFWFEWDQSGQPTGMSHERAKKPVVWKWDETTPTVDYRATLIN